MAGIEERVKGYFKECMRANEEVMTMKEIGGPYLDSVGVCRYLNKSIATLYRLIKRRNGLPCHRIGGRWLFIKSEVDEWVRNR